MFGVSSPACDQRGVGVGGPPLLARSALDVLIGEGGPPLLEIDGASSADFSGATASSDTIPEATTDTAS